MLDNLRNALAPIFTSRQEILIFFCCLICVHVQICKYVCEIMAISKKDLLKHRTCQIKRRYKRLKAILAFECATFDEEIR